ncbi:MAG: hypothetical protein NXI04_16265 [Planctomycetaceae bacterium]|nr:hypothetical protein [Planctomycetaceae bacterium]
MDLPESFSSDQLAAQLPHRDPDEPGSLRANIIDEVQDHLLQSLQKELLSNGDETDAQQRVIEKFGDPAATVRRLWFTEMRSRLMIRNVTLATSIAALAACLGAVWMVRGLAHDFRDSADATRELIANSEAANRELLAESQKQNQLVIERLTMMAQQPQEASRSAVWNPLKFKLESHESGGAPAVGFTVEIEGKLHTETTDARMDRESDENGEIDFGLVRPGTVQFTITSPWQSQRRGSLDVYPGMDHLETVICPGEPPEKKPVALNVQWPAFFADRKDIVLAFVVSEGRASQISDRSWSSHRRVVVLARPGQSLQYCEGDIYMDEALSSSARQAPASEPSVATVYSGTDLQEGNIAIRTDDFQVSSFAFLEAAELATSPPTKDLEYFATAAPLLAPAPFFRRALNQLTRGPVRSYTRSGFLRNETLAFERTPLDKPVTITIPDDILTEAMGRLSLHDMELEVSSATLMPAVSFFRMDTDGDGVVTEEEASSSRLYSSRTGRLRPDFPCTLRRLIEHNTEVR